MLRKEVRDRISKIIAGSRLTEHAFQVQFASKEYEDLVKIKYILRDSFKFSAGVAEKNGFWVTRSPGEQLLTGETYHAETVEQIIFQLEYWLKAVEVEDSVEPEIDSEINKLKEIFFRDLARHVKDENRHFTKEEADELIARVEKLEQQIEQVMAGQKKSESEIKSVKKQFQEAKKDTATMTKKKWLVVGGGKIFNALLSVATSKEGRVAIVDSIKGLLGNSKN